jgi:hypothetical protein
MTTQRLSISILLTVVSFSSLASTPDLDIAVKVTPSQHQFEADAHIILNNQARYTFELSPELIIDSADSAGQSVDVKNIGNAIQPRYEVTLPKFTKHPSLHLRYHGQLTELNSEFNQASPADRIPLFLSQEGSFLSANSHWYPDNGKLLTYKITLQTPEDQIAVVPGTPVSEENIDHVRHATFIMDHPIEGIDLMIGAYEVKEKSFNIQQKQITLRTYFHKEIAELADDYLTASKGYLERYSQQLGEYPYTHFSIVSSVLPTGLGMPSLTYLGREVLKLPFIKDTSLGHEVLHNWWGNGVFINSEQGNWSEGLTTFMADYAFKEDAGKDAAKDMRYGWLRDRQALPLGEEEPLSAFKARHHVASSTVGYGKSAMMFMALRAQLGDKNFYTALRTFWKKYQFKRAGFKELRQVFEQQSNTDLSRLFEQWLTKIGASDYAIKDAVYEDNRLRFKLKQTLRDNNALVPVRVFSAEGEEDFYIPVNHASTSSVLRPKARPVSMAIDPDFAVWRVLTPSESPPILRDVITSRKLSVLSLNDELKATSLETVKAISEGQVTPVTIEQANNNVPLVIVGDAQKLDGWLNLQHLPPRPLRLKEGDTQVWMLDKPKTRFLLMSLPSDPVQSENNLKALGSRLSHLGRYAWMTFENGKIKQRGNWKAESIRYLIPSQGN